MTPQDKAKELVGKYKEYTENNYAESWHNANQCAIIAVDEIILALEVFGYSGTFYDHEETRKMILTEDESPETYWQQVKEEINNL